MRDRHDGVRRADVVAFLIGSQIERLPPRGSTPISVKLAHRFSPRRAEPHRCVPRRGVQGGSLAYRSARNGIRRSGAEAIAGPNAHIPYHSRTPDRPARHPQLMPCAHSSRMAAGIQPAPICSLSQQRGGLSTAGAGSADGVIWADYYQNPMARHYSLAWLVATATPRRRAYGFRNRSGNLAMLAAMRRALLFWLGRCRPRRRLKHHHHSAVAAARTTQTTFQAR
jgi:hypothetical protein